MPDGECNRLLVVLTVHLLRGPRRPLDVTVEEIQQFLRLLRVQYVAAGTPYGDDERGFQRWVFAMWPAPPMA
jgi:hypothetical protein